MFADYHMHTSFSDDSIYPMEDEIKQAISLGIEEICFTEHVDHGIKEYPDSFYEDYYHEYKRMKTKYDGQIVMKFGAEFGMQTHTITQFQEDFNTHPFDFIILSCHQVNDQEFWTQEFQKGKTQEEYNIAYYQEILDVMKKYKDYCVLGHLDAIKRDDQVGILPFEKTKDIITEIFKQAIKDGKGIEVNTSNERYGLDDLTPCRDILRLYRELGGEILTFGSDTHKEEHVGYHIEQIKEELKAMGFTKFHTFDQMKPLAHKL